MVVTLQSVIPEDVELFTTLRKSVMREHVERLHSWDEEGEDKYNRSSFCVSTLKSIVTEGRIVGFINLRPADYQTISLGLFCIAKEYQGRGIGTKVLEIVFSFRPCVDTPTFLNVLKGSRAVKLYERFDFQYSHSDSISDYFRRLPK
jgi:ribosomal protein S18 acetylase RimI-like enzyme